MSPSARCSRCRRPVRCELVGTYPCLPPSLPLSDPLSTAPHFGSRDAHGPSRLALAWMANRSVNTDVDCQPQASSWPVTVPDAVAGGIGHGDTRNGERRGHGCGHARSGGVCVHTWTTGGLRDELVGPRGGIDSQDSHESQGRGVHR